MLSVENFYWVLFENLLKPVGLDAWYYYPFGTTNNLSRDNEFLPGHRCRYDHHALFHFDQEPLWEDDLGRLYDSNSSTWRFLILKLLANSERSDIKKQICARRGMLDWYFFYHGFAALDWYRDSQYIYDDEVPTKVFSSLNHLVTDKRCYRMALTARLSASEILPFGDVSFHATRDQCEREIRREHSHLGAKDIDLVQRMLDSQQLPMAVDSVKGYGELSAQFGHKEFKLWQKSLWHVVNETVFYDHKLHLTEKTFKPIVTKRPFILAAAPGNLRYLRSYGFKTFGDWIDESYDDISDPVARLDCIAKELTRLCALPWSELLSMQDDMKSTLEHNKAHFFGRFREIIVDELVDNFDTCVRIWNNGRIDGRDVSPHPDLDSVKRHLLI